MTDTIERATASGAGAAPVEGQLVDSAALAEVLFARWADARKHSRELLKREEFHQIPGLSMAEHRMRASGQLKRLVEEGVVHRAFPKSLGGEEDHGGNIAVVRRARHRPTRRCRSSRACSGGCSAPP